MAKNYGIFGRTSGKVGNVVFTNTSDGQIASAYNPNKPKERSQAQIDSSAKFAFMKKVSALFPPELLLGLGGNDKENRRKFDSMILRNVVWEGEGVERHPTLNASRIVLAEGNMRPIMEILYEQTYNYTQTGGKSRVRLRFESEVKKELFIFGQIVLGLSKEIDNEPILRIGVFSKNFLGTSFQGRFMFTTPERIFWARYNWISWLIMFEYNENIVNEYNLNMSETNLKAYDLSIWKKLFTLKRCDQILMQYDAV